MGPESGLSFNAAIRRLSGDEMCTPESPDVIPGMITVAMPVPSRRSQQSSAGLPPLEECQVSIMRYFEEVHCLYWLFSSDRFHIQLEKTYRTPLEKLTASWLCSLYSILAIVYVDPNGLGGHVTATEFLEQAKSYVSATCDEGTLDSVRAMVILVSNLFKFLRLEE
jgi:aldehyde dehydrogenase (NAD+)